MKATRVAAYAALYTAAAYIVDVPVRRALAARRARAYANARGLPLLNVGAGTNGVGLWSNDARCKAGQSACYPGTLYGDVNVDVTGRRDVPHGTPGVVTYADAENLKDFKAGQFGAVLASHVLEHLDHPMAALREWVRVTGKDPGALFIVTPSWWAPHAYWNSGHKFLFTDGAACIDTDCVPFQFRSTT
mgnify:CR=1 FL=1